jgi:hypothetical protein
MSDPRLAGTDDGYFVTCNPTLDTGLATIAAPTTGADIEPFLILKNNDVVVDKGGKLIYPDYIRLTCTGAGTNGASLRISAKIDSIARYTSGSTATVGPKNANMNSGQTTIALLYAGPLVAAAAGSAQRLLGQVLARMAIPVIGDEFVLKFGGAAPQPSIAKNGTAPTIYVINLPPCILGGGDSLLIHLWLPSQSVAGAYMVEEGHWEKVPSA